MTGRPALVSRDDIDAIIADPLRTMSAAAKDLGVTRETIRRTIRRLGLTAEYDRTRVRPHRIGEQEKKPRRRKDLVEFRVVAELAAARRGIDPKLLFS